MTKGFVFSIFAIAFGQLGCSVGDNGDSVSESYIEFDCEALRRDISNVDGLWNPINYSGSGKDPTPEEIADALLRCESIRLVNQGDEVPSDWDTFVFNGRIYYHVPLASNEFGK